MNGTEVSRYSRKPSWNGCDRYDLRRSAQSAERRQCKRGIIAWQLLVEGLSMYGGLQCLLKRRNNRRRGWERGKNTEGSDGGLVMLDIHQKFASILLLGISPSVPGG